MRDESRVAGELAEERTIRLLNEEIAELRGRIARAEQRERRQDERERGYHERERGYEQRQRGYEERQRGYEERQRGYEERQRGYEERQRGYEQRQHGYEKRERGYEERERGYEEAAGLAADRFAERGELLDEVNHRAKNSIQMAISLLTLQREASDDAEVRQSLTGAIGRLGHIARVHSMLYGHSPDQQTVDVAAYLASLCDELRGVAKAGGIALSCHSDALTLDTPRAVNLALIAGEAITNALNHAFPADRTGGIRVDCRRTGDDATLRIADDGVGLSEDYREGALGLKLIRSLAKGIGGTSSLAVDGGTRVTVTFPV